MKQALVAIAKKLARGVGYDTTHITRTVAYRAVEAWLDTKPCESLDVLEIAAGWKWRQRTWGSYAEMNWPEADICDDVLGQQFDLIIADNVWEHLLHPVRATQHVLQMLKPGGHFINITPFLVRYHAVPTDCTRWTELGMKRFLCDLGFEEDSMITGSWGNAAAVKANLVTWQRTGWRRVLPNDPRFPLTVWAIARKPA